MASTEASAFMNVSRVGCVPSSCKNDSCTEAACEDTVSIKQASLPKICNHNRSNSKVKCTNIRQSDKVKHNKYNTY